MATEELSHLREEWETGKLVRLEYAGEIVDFLINVAESQNDMQAAFESLPEDSRLKWLCVDLLVHRLKTAETLVDNFRDRKYAI